MRHPRTKRTLAGVATGVGVATAWAAVRLPAPDLGLGPGLQTVLGVGGLTVACLGGLLTVICHLSALRLARMRRGEGVLARWRVTPDAWRAFVEQSRTLDRQSHTHPNLLDLHGKPHDTGVDVIVAKDGVCVADDFHMLDKDVRIKIAREFMEFHQAVPRSGVGFMHTLLRVPLPADAARDAERIREHYETARVVAPSGPRFKLYLLAGLAALALVALIATLLPV